MTDWRRYPALGVLGLALTAACATSSRPAPKGTGDKAQDAPQRGPSTAAERGAFLEYWRQSEAEPLREDETMKAHRAWALRLMIQVPDYTVTLCGDLIPTDETEPAYPSAGLLLVNTGMAQFAYQIQHPGVSPVAEEVFTAGLESTLRMYGNILSASPSAHWKPLDALVERQAHGELASYVRSAKQACTKPHPAP